MSPYTHTHTLSIEQEDDEEEGRAYQIVSQKGRPPIAKGSVLEHHGFHAIRPPF